MILHLKKIILFFVLLMLTGLLFAQVKFSASVSPAVINKDEYVTIRFVIENANDIRQLNPPDFRKFILISGPNQETGMSSINGSVTQFSAVSYVLQPRSPGQYSINGATAVVGNSSLKSNPVKIIVRNILSGNAFAPPSASRGGFSDPFSQSAAPEFQDYILHTGENVQEKVAKNMQLRLQTDRTSCYVGEPIVASYKLYSRLKSESSLAKNPSFNGFSVIDLSQPGPSDYKRETLNGREYNVYNIRKAQLYPLQAGDVELETAVLENTIQFLKDGGTNQPNSVRDLVNGFSMSGETVPETVTLSSKPVTISVKPLPEANKPPSFKGAVGEFDFEAAPEKTSFSTDETGALGIRISGKGNLQLLTAPDINWPNGLEAFEPKVTDNTVRTTVPVSGNKVFVFPFAVEKAGTYILPPILFSYFDPVSGTYKTLQSKPFEFAIFKGKGTSALKQKSLVTKINPSLLNSSFNYRWWIIGLVSLSIFTLLFLWLKKESKIAEKKSNASTLAAKTENENVQAVLDKSELNQKNPLEGTERCLYQEDCVEFYRILNTEMKLFLAQKFGRHGQEFNFKFLLNALDRANVDNSLALKIEKLMQDLQFQIYTPFVQSEQRNQMYSRSHQLIQEINTSPEIAHAPATIL